MIYNVSLSRNLVSGLCSVCANLNYISNTASSETIVKCKEGIMDCCNKIICDKFKKW